MSTPDLTLGARPAVPTPSYFVGRMLHHKYLTYRNSWIAFLTGFLEPVFYLFSIGVGVGKLVGDFTVAGHSVPYAEFVAPGMLAASASSAGPADNG